jgi:membrane protease YdiL (CAAX protease family)
MQRAPVIADTKLPRYRLRWPTVVALATVLIVRPLLYTLVDHPFRRIGLVHGAGGRVSSWWLLQLWILFWTWLCFLVVWWSLRSSGESWSAVGVDFRFFVDHRVALLCLLVFLAGGAVIAGSFLYRGRWPTTSLTFGLLPVTLPERFVWLVTSLSTGLSEEVCYRGFPLRVLARSSTGAWFVLPFTMVAFVFVHGRYGARHPLPYLAFALLFGAAFILLGRRRLEWLIIAHALFDGFGVFAP